MIYFNNDYSEGCHEAVAKKYGIPEFMLKDRNIPENTDLDTYFKDMKQDMSNNGFQHKFGNTVLLRHCQNPRIALRLHFL